MSEVRLLDRFLRKETATESVIHLRTRATGAGVSCGENRWQTEMGTIIIVISAYIGIVGLFILSLCQIAKGN
jgi:hypothetical protein